MATEIERKFLVDLTVLGPLEPGRRIQQGYITTQGDATVRARTYGEQAFLTLKGKTTGASRAEFEYQIPIEDAQQIIATLCDGPVIDKTRHIIEYAGHTWELDVFHGANEGLVIAEIELDSETESFETPPWATRDVTEDPRYYNANLANHPFSAW